MTFKNHFVTRAVLSAFATAVFSFAAAAQSQPTPALIMPTPKPPSAVAGSNNLYCAGYIQKGAISTENRLIGAVDEADKYNYSQNDFVYINMGANKGVNVGDMFSIVRPRGQVKSKWSDKGTLGFYVQEVGAVEVVSVKNNYAAARVSSSCDSFLLGDLVQLTERRVSPIANNRPAFDIFRDPSGKARGRIIMARDMAEMLSRDFIVYVDLGAEDNVQIGDRLTIYRPLGKGNITNKGQNEAVSARDYGFESEVYKGGKFSNHAPRKSGSHAAGQEQSTRRAKIGRPEGMRKVVGEAVVLNVKEKTATVVITRTASEIHTGDRVEIQ